ncbi:hypothetical protein PCI56_10735 [Plesiomonas shigelloides subsp. oncorhynchi]|nr:hypothetical protein [Plesiomonas shigelloides]
MQLVLPEVLVGFFAAVVVGAVFSTFSGGLNSSVTLFTVNIFKNPSNRMRPKRKPWPWVNIWA